MPIIAEFKLRFLDDYHQTVVEMARVNVPIIMVASIVHCIELIGHARPHGCHRQ